MHARPGFPRRSIALLALGCAPLFAVAACSAPPLPDVPEQPAAPPPPDRPPTPASIDHHNPGGDADDPVKAALQRLLTEPFSSKRRDRFRTLAVPLADWKNWRRTRIPSQPLRATFRYGDDHLALIALRYTPIEGPDDPEHCLADFVKYATPIADSYGIRLGKSELVSTQQDFRGETRPILVRLQEGGIDSVFKADDYMGFIAAYQSWPGTCLVQSFAVVATDHPDLARKVRDRWVAEAIPKLTWERRVKQAPEPKAAR
ncbi:MAG: hypothetical protein R3F14_22730 [Polyangiaceae bacterium]